MTNSIKRTIWVILLSFAVMVLAGVLYLALGTQGSTESTDSNNENFRGFLGEGTVEEPFLIGSSSELSSFAEAVSVGEWYNSCVYELTSDIDMEGEQIHIGVDEDFSFRGVFRGNGYCISNCQYDNPSGYAGLFPFLNGEVYNLEVRDSSFTGEICGAIAGAMGKDGGIYNCLSDGDISFGDNGKIVNCYSLMDSCDISPSDAAIKLNRSMGRVRYDYDFCYWEADEDKLTISNRHADRFLESKVSATIDGVNKSLKGFFSVDNGCWCFVLPESELGDQALKATFYKNKGKKRIKLPAENKVVTFEDNGIEYQAMVLSYDDLPTFFVETEIDDSLDYLYMDKGNKLYGALSVFDENMDKVSQLELKEITCRGNSSYSKDIFDKNSFKLELGSETSLLGLTKNDDFLLIAGYRDNSLLSYMLERDICKQLGIEYASDYRLANVYIDDTYMGLYFVVGSQEIANGRFDLKPSYKETEKVNTGKLSEYEQMEWADEATGAERVYYDIPNNPEDITGGYILEVDYNNYPKSRSRFISNRGTTLTMKSNNYATKQQVDYCADMWQGFEDAIFSEDGYSEDNRYYTEYMDMESLADLCMIFEITQDVAMTGSIYFYKDSLENGDSTLHAAWHWDCEHSFTYTDYADDIEWIVDNPKSEGTNKRAAFWTQLYTHEDLMDCMRQKWNNEYRDALLSALANEDYHNEDGVSSLLWYVNKYNKSALANSYRWANCNMSDKARDVSSYIERRITAIDGWLN